MLRVELTTQLLRIRTLVVLACLAAVPVMAGLSYASHAGHRNGRQTGLFGASPYSALNHAMASMAFIEPLLLPIMVALPAAAIASSDREWGTLRYLYVAPVSRTRLLAAKLGALTVLTVIAALSVLTAGLLVGLAVFVAASLLNGSHTLHPVQVVLPMHYWQDWTHLFDPSGTAHLGTGILVQIATSALATCAAVLVLLRRDPAA
ncbi:hypothetical protein CG747_44275 [Streptomyces sp. CB02959]|uniref:ABC transporter permease n=1 Tax=Streptomyces sp. CB02959 TaxID=2020330 RepID=UPI000C271F35|nr:ABC transporter permease [Streptomyces sp. CB02959]PJN31622.1 hypothetical protein CG747_44275 [Streptomyces sp. CB02959]